MGGWSRRNWLTSLALAAAGQAPIANAWQVRSKKGAIDKEKLSTRKKLALEDYETEEHASYARDPEFRAQDSRRVDFHTHLSWSARRGRVTTAHNNAALEEVLPVMDRKERADDGEPYRGYGQVLEQTINYWQRPHPDRFVVFTEPWFDKITEPGYPQFQADQIARAQALGARGLKLLKTLGLYLRERVTMDLL